MERLPAMVNAFLCHIMNKLLPENEITRIFVVSFGVPANG